MERAIGPSDAEESRADPTVEELVRRAEELRPIIREQQDATEERGHYGTDLHEALLTRDFYRILTPRRYGGLELPLEYYLRVVIEVSRGDPSTGWCYSLGHNHNITTAAHWSAECQDLVFPHPSGYFRASHAVPPVSKARRVEGGYVVNGRSGYHSGIQYAGYATLNALVEGTSGPRGPQNIAVIIPVEEVTVLDDWRGEQVLGLRGTGSDSVVCDDVFVPDVRVSTFDWNDHDYTEPSPGTELHGNPMYLGPVAAFFHLAIVGPMIGAAKAAIDSYEEIVTTRKTVRAPFTLRSEHPQHQADLGMAITMTDTAEAIVIRACQMFTDYAADTVERGIPFTVEKDVRLYGMVQRAGELATDAVAMLFRSAGSSAGKHGHPMERYFRDTSMFRQHVSAQYRWAAQNLGALHLGIAKTAY